VFFSSNSIHSSVFFFIALNSLIRVFFIALNSITRVFFIPLNSITRVFFIPLNSITRVFSSRSIQSSVFFHPAQFNHPCFFQLNPYKIFITTIITSRLGCQIHFTIKTRKKLPTGKFNYVISETSMSGKIARMNRIVSYFDNWHNSEKNRDNNSDE
jgi:hypothetical protein